MMHMYPYNNLNSFNSFEGESSFVQAQGFAFQQQQNWNLYNQLAVDPFIFESNNMVNALVPTDQIFAQHNFQQSLKNTTKKEQNNIYSKFTIPSITSIISNPPITNNVDIINFPSSLSTPNNVFPIEPSSNNVFPIAPSPNNVFPISPSSNNVFPIAPSSNNVFPIAPSSNNVFPIVPSSKIPSIPSRPNSPMEIDFNYNDNINLLNQSQVQNSIPSSNSLSYFVTPDKDTAISLQDIIDGMNVMQEISREMATYNLDNNFLQEVMNGLTTDLNENPIEWLIQENWKEMSKRIDNYEFKETLTEKKLDEKFSQDIDDLIEEHMKEIKKFVHNEVLCQEILTETSNLEYQLKNGTIQTEGSTSSSIHHQGVSQEAVPSMFVPRENNFSYTIGETSIKSDATKDQRTLKCNEIGCSKEYNCYAKLKSHKVTHTNDKPITCNVLGCNKKFKRSGELIKHQLDHLN